MKKRNLAVILLVLCCLLTGCSSARDTRSAARYTANPVAAYQAGGISLTRSTQAPAKKSTQTQTYIGNKNTHKFHYPWCSSVDQMKEKNKITITDRDEAIRYGYEPCGRCNP